MPDAVPTPHTCRVQQCPEAQSLGGADAGLWREARPSTALPRGLPLQPDTVLGPLWEIWVAQDESHRAQHGRRAAGSGQRAVGSGGLNGNSTVDPESYHSPVCSELPASANHGQAATLEKPRVWETKTTTTHPTKPRKQLLGGNTGQTERRKLQAKLCL